MSRSIVRLFSQVKAARRECFNSPSCRSFSSKGNRHAGEHYANDGPSKYLLLAVPVATFCLGTWQVYRRGWKLGLIKKLEERTSADPVPLPETLEELQEMEYRKFTLRGKFDHSKEIYIGPRSLISDGSGIPSHSGLVSSGQSGYCVITPFKLSDSNLTVLVNRGWVPRKKVEPATRPQGQIEDEFNLVGVYRNPEKRPQFVPQNPPGSRIFHYRDVETMGRMVNAAPIYFDADYNSTIDGGPIGGQTIVTLRNDHVSYILTWYSLSLVTLYLWHRRFIRMLPLM